MSNKGATHVDLLGAAASHRYRAVRLASATVGELSCSLTGDGAPGGVLAVADVSATGMGVAPPSGWLTAPGQVLTATILHRGTALWSTPVVVVYQLDGPPARVGLRFAAELFPIDRLRLRDQITSGVLGASLAAYDEQRGQLSAEFRAGLADVVQLLHEAARAFEELERTGVATDVRLDGDEQVLFAEIYELWRPRYHAALAGLYQLAQAMPADTKALAEQVAHQVIYPLIEGCPMHRRSYEKPLGYAGDYQLMRMCFNERSSAPALFDRYLSYVAQRYPGVQAVIHRELTLRQAAREVVARGPLNVVSLASGPAIELQRVVADLPAGTEVRLTLIDQDEEALAYSHRALIALAASRGINLDLRAMHISIRQILKPKDAEEARAVEAAFEDAALIYSAGLLDYLPTPVAGNLFRTLYARLAPGGRLMIGNLQADPATTFLIGHVLSWHLVYRDEEAMRRFAEPLRPAPLSVGIVPDATGVCLFLDLRRP
ncbi:MAG: hypothetical protein KBG28_30405 [Kofleriaceae bacterium]|jgi:extracellular factor (EF) 3-hydroxypalmitic acid methyl ester biosynthesis protein|nr:hypothetical protein [Kofleriaceae bacterium]